LVSKDSYYKQHNTNSLFERINDARSFEFHAMGWYAGGRYLQRIYIGTDIYQAGIQFEFNAAQSVNVEASFFLKKKKTACPC
jgi:hypothetical protein